MIPLPMLGLYCIAGYALWYVMIRICLVLAVLYVNPKKIGIRQWLFIIAALLPLSLEVMSSILIPLAMVANAKEIKNASTDPSDYFRYQYS